MTTILLSVVDDLIRPDHAYLGADDLCWYLREYTSTKGYAYSETNSLISNLKKPVSLRGSTQWRYKMKAINKCAEELRGALVSKVLTDATFVPIPPSKVKTDPEYDDRLVRVLSAFKGTRSIDVRELVLQSSSTPPVHTGPRIAPDHLVKNYSIDQSLVAPAPKSIVVFDDMLTTGAHFVAVKRVLSSHFPGVKISGVFLARRVFAPEDEE